MAAIIIRMQFIGKGMTSLVTLDIFQGTLKSLKKEDREKIPM
jgi:hypothetical protein